MFQHKGSTEIDNHRVSPLTGKNPPTSIAPSSVPEYVSQCLQLAILLEVSAYPKPGNVHRTANFQETRYEHFLASAVAIAPYLRKAAERGARVPKRSLTLDRINVGRIIRDSVSDVAVWQSDRNTLLGSVTLLVPIAAAAGLTMAKKRLFSVNALRRNLKSIVEATTPKDAVYFYDAIAIAKPGGLGKTPRLDVSDKTSKRQILAQSTNLYEIFKISSPWDSIAAEWTNNFHTTFDIGYSFFKAQMEKAGDINSASVQTFLRILSLVPDTLIARKAGRPKAEWVSKEAGKVLDAGGVATSEGRYGLGKLDKELHDASHKLNPGTTADITSAVLALAVLEGYRP
jgi:triphosphoribosyl-dephospho-CoA synthase